MSAALPAPKAIDARPSARARAECTALARNDSARTRGEVRALTQALSAHLLAASSATNALHAWCEARGLAEGSIVARLHFQDQAPTLDEDTRKRLHVGTDEPVHRRRVELMRGELVLSEADNWFLPGRLAPSMRELLATTTIPFGKIVERLRPMRRTFLVIFSDLPPSSDATAFRGGGVDAGPARAGASLPRIVLEHRAIVLRADLKPIAIVHERYRSELIGGAASLHARPQPSGGSKEPRSP